MLHLPFELVEVLVVVLSHGQVAPAPGAGFHLIRDLEVVAEQIAGQVRAVSGVLHLQKLPVNMFIAMGQIPLKVLHLSLKRVVIQTACLAEVHQRGEPAVVPLADAVARARVAQGDGSEVGLQLDVGQHAAGRRMVQAHLLCQEAIEYHGIGGDVGRRIPGRIHRKAREFAIMHLVIPHLLQGSLGISVLRIAGLDAQIHDQAILVHRLLFLLV